MKICPKCNTERTYDCFHKSKINKSGLSVYCKSCTKNYREQNKEILRQKKKKYYSRPEIKEREKKVHAERYRNNREEHVRKIRDFYEENRERFLLKKSRERAKAAGLEHTIQLEDIVIPKFCPVLGLELTSSLGKGQLQTNASIDRIDSNKGYIPGNIQVISRKANTMKSNATYEELKKFGEWCAKL